jgi:outer membrane protein assembly factor BamB
MYQMDPQHTGRSLHEGPARGTLLRTFDTANPRLALVDPGDPRPEIQSSAVVGPDGTFYIGNFPGGLYALRDADRGGDLDLVWRFHPPGASSFHGTPALGPDGTVYLGFSTGGASPDARGTFYAIRGRPEEDAAEARWSLDLGPGRQTSSPTLGDDGTIYVVSGAGRLFAIAENGTVRWTAKVGPTLKSSPALARDGTIYVASMDGRLYAVAPPANKNGNEGTMRWAFDFGKHPGREPLVTSAVPPPGADGVGSGASPTVGPDETIYVGANNSNLYAIAPDGSLRWMYEAEREVAGIWSAPVLSTDDRTLYFGANKGGIYAVDRESGSQRWRFNVFGSVYSSLTLDGRGILYTGSTVGHVFALDSVSGDMLWDFDAGAPVWTAPALRPDGTLVVADTRGQVMVLGDG